MLLNLHKRGWTEGLKLRDFEEQEKSNEAALTVSSQPRFLFSQTHKSP
jgi:26S proteasome regulatory subunit N11